MKTFEKQADIYKEFDELLEGGKYFREYFDHAIWPIMNTICCEIIGKNIMYTTFKNDNKYINMSVSKEIKNVFWYYYNQNFQVELKSEENQPFYRSYREVFTPTIIFNWLLSIKEDDYNTWYLENNYKQSFRKVNIISFSY